MRRTLKKLARGNFRKKSRRKTRKIPRKRTRRKRGGGDEEPEQPKQPKQPNKYLCMITRQLMADPVSAPDGQIYERNAIETWLSGNATSPVNREPMTADQLNGVVYLRNEILEWCDKNVVDHPVAPAAAAAAAGGAEGPPVPEYFKCPISKDAMYDPVIDLNGNSYERNFIVNWLTQYKKSPDCFSFPPHCVSDNRDGQPDMEIKDLVSNHGLSRAINASVWAPAAAAAAASRAAQAAADAPAAAAAAASRAAQAAADAPAAQADEDQISWMPR
jgi:hypothetical protein